MGRCFRTGKRFLFGVLVYLGSRIAHVVGEKIESLLVSIHQVYFEFHETDVVSIYLVPSQHDTCSYLLESRAFPQGQMPGE